MKNNKAILGVLVLAIVVMGAALLRTNSSLQKAQTLDATKGEMKTQSLEDAVKNAGGKIYDLDKEQQTVVLESYAKIREVAEGVSGTTTNEVLIYLCGGTPDQPVPRVVTSTGPLNIRGCTSIHGTVAF
jgi:hypothetical protein